MFKMFAIFDKKACIYFQPSYFLNKSLALRSFTELVNDPKTQIYKYPSDFSIWIVGEWNEKLGTIIPNKNPEFLEEAINVKESIKNE